MRKDTSFSDRKLTEEEFADKYWMGGEEGYIYQYHTASIMDGRDEREQFVFNNVRALYNLHSEFFVKARTDIVHLQLETRKLKKAVRNSYILQLIEMGMVILLSLLLILGR